MDPKILKSITVQIHRRFPEFQGCQPKVRRRQPSGAGVPLPKGGPSTFLLTYHQTGRTNPDGTGKAIPRWVRVVVTDGGRILKITTSR